MSDTPRTDVLLIAHDMSPTHILLISHSKELERELNAANERIKRLEEAGDELLRDNDDMANINRWLRAKEAKL